MATRINIAEDTAPASNPASATVDIYVKADGKVYSKDDAGTEYDLTAGAASGDTHPIVDTTAIVKGATDSTKTLKMDVGGQATGVTGQLATTFSTAKTITFPDVADTVCGVSATQTLFNKTIDGNSNTIQLLSGTTTGVAPSYFTMALVIGPPSTIYCTGQITGGVWSWAKLFEFP